MQVFCHFSPISLGNFYGVSCRPKLQLYFQQPVGLFGTLWLVSKKLAGSQIMDVLGPEWGPSQAHSAKQNIITRAVKKKKTPLISHEYRYSKRELFHYFFYLRIRKSRKKSFFICFSSKSRTDWWMEKSTKTSGK